MDAYIHALLYGSTVGDALNFVKSEWGETDDDWRDIYRIGYTENHGAICKLYEGDSAYSLYEGENAMLVDVTNECEESMSVVVCGQVTDEDNNPISSATVTLKPTVNNTLSNITTRTNQK